MLAGNEINREEDGMIRVGYESKRLSIKKKNLFPSHPSANFKLQKKYQDEPIFNWV